MNFRNYLTILWRRKAVILVTVLLALAIAIAGFQLMQPVYSATAILRLGTITSGASDFVDFDLAYSDRLMSTLADLATTRSMRQILAERYSLGALPEIKVEIVANTELMRISAWHAEPWLAAVLANNMATVLIDQSRGGSLSNRLSTSTVSRNTLVVVDPAVVPSQPAGPSRLLIPSLGLVIGLIGGLGLAFLFENLDPYLLSGERIEQVVRADALGLIPSVTRADRDALWTDRTPHREACRRLAANLLSRSHEQPIKTVLVTSADPGEGKSTVVANLALAIAQSGHKVLVIDCNFLRPTLHETFSLPNRTGLSTLLNQESIESGAATQQASSGIRVITSGPPVPRDSWGLLSSPRFATRIARFKEEFDIVLLDAPALLAVADAAALAPHVDGVALVVAISHARQATVETSRRQLDSVGANLLGTVINRVSPHNYWNASRSNPGDLSESDDTRWDGEADVRSEWTPRLVNKG